jgi:hypothetical protein
MGIQIMLVAAAALLGATFFVMRRISGKPAGMPATPHETPAATIAPAPSAAAGASAWVGWAFGVIGVGIVGFIFYYHYTQATIYIDNATGQLVRLEVDGRPWQEIEPATMSIKFSKLRWGKHVIVVYARADNKALDRLEVNIEDNGPYVFNVLGAQTYLKGSAFYGLRGGGLGPETPVREKWFKPNVDLLFQHPPPGISVRGQSSATRTYLVKG